MKLRQFINNSLVVDKSSSRLTLKEIMEKMDVEMEPKCNAKAINM